MAPRGDPTASLAPWSDWTPLSTARDSAPRLPGVYLIRQGSSGPVRYVGSAGPRDGKNGDKPPKGIRGRLRVYTSGKALTSGLGEALADRALADPEFLRERLAEAEAGTPLRAKDWGKATVDRADLHVRWATTATKEEAEDLETECGLLLQGPALWNRRVFVRRPAR
jgi:hypothetical protein